MALIIIERDGPIRMSMLSGHFQTILGAAMPSPRLTQQGERWVIPLADGDSLVARVHGCEFPQRVVLLFHGLGGDIESTYIHRCALLALKFNSLVVRVNFRGAGESATLSQGLYHSGRSADMSDVIAVTRARWPGLKILASGFSMSGNILLNLLAGYDGDERPDEACVFNPAFQLHHCSERLRTSGRIYDWLFVRDLKKLLLQRKDRERFSIHFDRIKTVADFDDLITAPEAKFKNRDEYYQKCSAYFRVNQIKTPVAVITAADDPIVPVKDFETARWSDFAKVKIKKYGGHLGSLHPRPGPLKSYRWLDEEFVKILASLR